jgi:hypothetical protein
MAASLPCSCNRTYIFHARATASAMASSFWCEHFKWRKQIPTCTTIRGNPIIRPDKDHWDHDAVYKPYAVFDGRQWLLWYNGRKGGVEQIGLALHEGEDLGF